MPGPHRLDHGEVDEPHVADDRQPERRQGADLGPVHAGLQAKASGQVAQHGDPHPAEGRPGEPPQSLHADVDAVTSHGNGESCKTALGVFTLAMVRCGHRRAQAGEDDTAPELAGQARQGRRPAPTSPPGH